MNVESVELDGDEFDEYQHELSSNLANDFLDTEIFPVLEKFDFSNQSTEYIPGVATFTLFARLVVQLINDGYTVDDINDAVADFSQHCVDGTIH